MMILDNQEQPDIINIQGCWLLERILKGPVLDNRVRGEKTTAKVSTRGSDFKSIRSSGEMNKNTLMSKKRI